MYKEWINLNAPKDPTYRVYMMPSGYWGILGLTSNVEAVHEDFDQAEKSAVALESRLYSKGSRRTRARMWRENRP